MQRLSENETYRQGPPIPQMPSNGPPPMNVTQQFHPGMAPYGHSSLPQRQQPAPQSSQPPLGLSHGYAPQTMPAQTDPASRPAISQGHQQPYPGYPPNRPTPPLRPEGFSRPDFGPAHYRPEVGVTPQPSYVGQQQQPPAPGDYGQRPPVPRPPYQQPNPYPPQAQFPPSGPYQNQTPTGQAPPQIPPKLPVNQPPVPPRPDMYAMRHPAPQAFYQGQQGAAHSNPAYGPPPGNYGPPPPQQVHYGLPPAGPYGHPQPMQGYPPNRQPVGQQYQGPPLTREMPPQFPPQQGIQGGYPPQQYGQYPPQQLNQGRPPYAAGYAQAPLQQQGYPGQPVNQPQYGQPQGQHGGYAPQHPPRPNNSLMD